MSHPPGTLFPDLARPPCESGLLHCRRGARTKWQCGCLAQTQGVPIWPKRPIATLGPVDLDAALEDYREAVDGIEAAKRTAKRRIAAARAYVDETRKVLHAAMVEAAQNGTAPVEIQRKTGYTKERVRQILRAGGVEPD